MIPSNLGSTPRPRDSRIIGTFHQRSHAFPSRLNPDFSRLSSENQTLSARKGNPIGPAAAKPVFSAVALISPDPARRNTRSARLARPFPEGNLPAAIGSSRPARRPVTTRAGILASRVSVLPDKQQGLAIDHRAARPKTQELGVHVNQQGSISPASRQEAPPWNFPTRKRCDLRACFPGGLPFRLRTTKGGPT